MGGKGGGGDTQDNPYEEQAARQAEELWGLAKPILGGTGETVQIGDEFVDTQRSGLLGRFMDLMEGTYDPTSDPMYRNEIALGKSNIERAFHGSEGEILSSLPKGGALEMALAGNAMDKGSALSDFMNKLISSKYGNLQDIMVSFGLGTPFRSTDALTDAAAVQANRYASDQERAGAEKAGFTNTLGGLGYAIGSGK